MKKPRRTPCAYRGWSIRGVGGFVTCRHFWAEKGERAFNDYKLRDMLAEIDALESGELAWKDIDDYRKRALYH